jgi:hypothetical protein
MANELIAYYAPGARITARASAAVTGKRFLKISGNRTSASGSGLTSTAEGGVIQVAHADAAGRVCGVANADAGIGEMVGIERGNSKVVPVTASGAIAAFAEVEVGATGMAVTKTTGIAVGYAITAAADGADAQISLY